MPDFKRVNKKQRVKKYILYDKLNEEIVAFTSMAYKLPFLLLLD
jgi:hypothetical protein